MVSSLNQKLKLFNSDTTFKIKVVKKTIQTTNNKFNSLNLFDVVILVVFYIFVKLIKFDIMIKIFNKEKVCQHLKS